MNPLDFLYLVSKDAVDVHDHSKVCQMVTSAPSARFVYGEVRNWINTFSLVNEDFRFYH